MKKWIVPIVLSLLFTGVSACSKSKDKKSDNGAGKAVGAPSGVPHGKFEELSEEPRSSQNLGQCGQGEDRYIFPTLANFQSFRLERIWLDKEKNYRAQNERVSFFDVNLAARQYSKRVEFLDAEYGDWFWLTTRCVLPERAISFNCETLASQAKLSDASPARLPRAEMRPNCHMQRDSIKVTSQEFIYVNYTFPEGGKTVPAQITRLTYGGTVECYEQSGYVVRGEGVKTLYMVTSYGIPHVLDMALSCTGGMPLFLADKIVLNDGTVLVDSQLEMFEPNF